MQRDTERLPRHVGTGAGRPAGVCSGVRVCLLALLLAVPGSAAGTGVDLIGAWHVNVHFRDTQSPEPEVDRWEDKVWRFEQRGSRLQWTEFPTVVFSKRAGRFELNEGGRPMRILHSWEPDEEQRAEIRAGLLVDPLGARSKSLRGSPDAGYESAGGLREEISVIGYSESWRIEGLPLLPIFTRIDVMGAGSTDNIEGQTRYRTDGISADGNEVRGVFARDGSRRGRFTMRRMGDLVVRGGKRDPGRRDAE
jgi:hypothetical protein